MKPVITALFFSLISSFSFAATTTNVKCWIPGKFEIREFVVVKFVNDSITYWSEKTVGRPDAKSNFGLFSEDINESSIESVKFGKYRNGYKFAAIITTADALTLGISPDYKRGFLKYEDLGSGNGNEAFELKCAVVR